MHEKLNICVDLVPVIGLVWTALAASLVPGVGLEPTYPYG